MGACVSFREATPTLYFFDRPDTKHSCYHLQGMWEKVEGSKGVQTTNTSLVHCLVYKQRGPTELTIGPLRLPYVLNVR